MSDFREFAQASKAWPFEEARNLMEKRLRGKVPEKGFVLFETGYGPSGLPHIGTFGEVARTIMVKNAFALLFPEFKTKLFCFSDDMDGLRKVPDNIPNKDMVAQHLGKSLTTIPDPFGKYESFGHHNNARLKGFLDSFGFDYEFKSSTECYKSGMFDKTLLAILKHYDEVINVVLPTLGDERKATYSPYLPVCKKTGKVLQVPVVETKPESGTIIYRDEDGSLVETEVTGGNCKLQWKVDWAMRWTALDVNYEMSGKDLTDSVRLSSRICKILGGEAPQNLTYELFLDDKGEKISKSKGNGLAVEDWLKYAPQESLALFMYQKPKTAKKLYFDVIPRAIDDYIAFIENYPKQKDAEKIDNPAWHIHSGKVPQPEASISMSVLLNLVSVCGSDDPAAIWHYISAYEPKATPESCPFLNKLVGFAISYYKDFVLPNKKFKTPNDDEKRVLSILKDKLETLPEKSTADEVQSAVYAVGKENLDVFAGELRNWFKALYEIILGQDQGPRMGSVFALYGLKKSADLIDQILHKI
ncbi:MAG: lysine--tRNA ligase [Alphaproteobacteria bacterium]